MLTDEDIDTSVQDINEKEQPIISMSSLQEQSVTDEPSAVNSTEIDAIQKHVEESLLFLDHDKATNNVLEKMDQNVDSEPIKVVWETSKCESKIDVSETKLENKNESIEPSVISSSQNDVEETSIKATNNIPAKIDQNVDSEPIQEIVWETSKCESEMDVSETKLENKNESIEPSVISSSQDDVEETSIKATNNIPAKIDQNVDSKPIQEIVWETSKCESEMDVSETILENKDESLESVITSSQGDVQATSIIANQGQNATDINEKMDEDIESNVQELPQILLAQVEEPAVSLEQNKNTSEAPQKVNNDFENNVSETPLASSSQEESEGSVLPVKHAQSEIEFSDSIEGNGNSVEQLNIENNMDHEDSTSPENTHTNVHVDIKKQNVFESLPLDSAQNKTNEVAEEIIKNNTSTGQSEPQNTTIQAITESNPSLEPAQTVTSKNLEEYDRSINLLSSNQQKNDQENPISLGNIKETGDNCKDISINPTEDATDGTNLQEKHVEKEVLDKNVESSQVSEESIQESVISPTRDKDVEDVNVMPEIKNSKFPVEPAEMMPHWVEYQTITESCEKTEAVNIKEENLAVIKPPLIASTQEGDRKLEIEQIATVIKIEPNQDRVKDLPTQIAEAKVNSENRRGNDINLKEVGLTIKQENVSPEILTKVEQKSIGSNVAAKPQEARKSLISSAQIQKVTKVPQIMNSKLIYNANSVHSNALKAIPQQLPTLKGTENISVAKAKSTNSESTAPPQNATKVTSPWQDAQSGSSKVFDDECPPAKRARVEPTWSTACENMEDPSTSPKETPVSWSVSASYDDDDVESPSPSDTSIQWDTSNEPANRPQSSCSSVLEETPMDLDDGDNQQPDTHYYINVPEFIEWALKHRVIKEHQNPSTWHLRHLAQANRTNKSVLRVWPIPKTFSRGDVYKLIKKYTMDTGKEIATKIAYIYLERSNPSCNTAFVKWKNEDRLLTIKAYLVIKRAELVLEGKRKLIVAYDNRTVIDWTADDKPIVLGKNPDKNKIQMAPKQNEKQKLQGNLKINPFYNGDIDHKDIVTFGLTKEFLASLNLTLPLRSAITVDNVDNENTEASLRRLFNLAGIIKSFEIAHKETDLSINIDYEHIVEAVQAISMFNQKCLKGRVLIVTMDKTSRLTEHNLPEEIPNLGLGLGFKGKPLIGVSTIIAIRRTKDAVGKEITKLKQAVSASKLKLNEAFVNHGHLEKKIQKQIKIMQEKQHTTDTLKENTAAQNDSQNILASLSSMIANSIQTNLMSSFAQNFPQGYASQTMSPGNAMPNWSTPNENYNWAQAQPNYTDNMQMQQAYAQPGLMNMQTASNMQANLANVANHNAQQIPNIQPMPQARVNVQPVEYTMAYSTSTPIPPSIISNIQPVHYPQPQGVTAVHDSSLAYPQLPVTNVEITKPKFVSRFDVPPSGVVISKPPIRAQVQPAPIVNIPTKPAPVKALEIPVVIPKPQNRESTKPPINVKTVPLPKAPKAAAIKISIPSLQVPVTSESDKPSTSQAHSRASPSAQKRKSPVKDPWLMKQIRAMRRNSKSPERSRTHSPRYDKQKDSNRSGDSRDKEKDKDHQRYTPNTSVMFKHLPPSVTSDDLKEKMREIGKVISAQVNSKGQALVKFRSRRDAETCIEMYNKAKVDGQTIEAKWLK